MWPSGGVPSVADIKRERWAKEIPEVIPAAYRKNRRKAAAHIRGLLRLADRLDLVTVFDAAHEKRSGRPAGAVTASRLGRWVWVARNYRISYAAILNVINAGSPIPRDNRWVMIRVAQTEAAIRHGVFSPEAVIAELDRLQPRERRAVILDKLTKLARTATD